MTQLVSRLEGWLKRLREALQGLVGRRSLMFYVWTHGTANTSYCSNDSVSVRKLSIQEFQSLEWSGNRWVFSEAHDWSGHGTRQAFSAFIGNDLAGFGWVESNCIDLRFFRTLIPIPNSVAYFSRLYVANQLRGRGIAGCLLRARQQAIVEQGFASAIGCCVPENSAVRHMYTNNGFHYFARVQRFYIWRLSVFRVLYPGSTVRWTVSPSTLGKLLTTWHGNFIKPSWPIDMV